MITINSENYILNMSSYLTNIKISKMQCSVKTNSQHSIQKRKNIIFNNFPLFAVMPDLVFRRNEACMPNGGKNHSK